MSGKVITLDGLNNAAVPKIGMCDDLVSIYSPVIDQKVQVCASDALVAAASKGLSVEEFKTGKRGRPKGKTVKTGAKKPSVPTCKAFKKTKNSKGREICKCATPGNSQIQANAKCEI